MIKTMKSTGEVTNKIETLQSCEVGATGIIKKLIWDASWYLKSVWQEYTASHSLKMLDNSKQ